jgi:hypothetical protein
MKLSTLVAGAACSGAVSALYIPPRIFDFNMTTVINVDNNHSKVGKAPEHIADNIYQSVNSPILPAKNGNRTKGYGLQADGDCGPLRLAARTNATAASLHLCRFPTRINNLQFYRKHEVNKLIARLNATAPKLINQAEAHRHLREDNVFQIPVRASYPTEEEIARDLACLQKLTDITDTTVRNQTENDRLQARATKALIRQGFSSHGDVPAIIVKIREKKMEAIFEKLEAVSTKLEAVLASQINKNVAVNQTGSSGNRGLITRARVVPDTSSAHLDFWKRLCERQRKVATPTSCNTTDGSVRDRWLLETLSKVIFADLPAESQLPRGPTLIKGGCDHEGHGGRDCYVEPREGEDEE